MQLLLVAPLLLGCLPWVLTLVLPGWLVVGSMVLILGVPCLFVAALTLLFLQDWRAFTPFTPSSKPARKLGHRRYRDAEDLPEGDIDAVIIGSGQGGLSCGATLAQFGERVVVCEQHEVTGGGAHSFAADGRSKWMFDAGLHITIPLHEQVLQAACGAARPPVRFRRLRDDDRGASDYIALGGAPEGEAALPVVAGPLEGRLNLEVELAARFPDHEAALRNYFELAERYGRLESSNR